VLTNSFLALQIQQQTVSITQAQQATTDAINALRREVMQQTRTLTQTPHDQRPNRQLRPGAICDTHGTPLTVEVDPATCGVYRRGQA
jgi:hypothetical protein